MARNGAKKGNDMESIDRAEIAGGEVEGPGPATGVARAGKRIVYVVANRTGGQGKTLVTQLLLAGRPGLKVFSADSETAAGDSKLVRTMRNNVEGGPIRVDELGIGWSAERARKEESSMFWDDLGSKLLSEEFNEPGAVIDMGANVVGSFVTWGKGFNAKRLFHDKIDFVFVIPMVASPQAIADAGDVLSSLIEERKNRGLPVIGATLVRNAWQGAFDKSLEALVEKTAAGMPFPVSVMGLDGAEPLISRKFEEASEPVGNIVGYSVDVLKSKFGLNYFQADRSGEQYLEWFEGARADLRARTSFDPAKPEIEDATDTHAV